MFGKNLAAISFLLICFFNCTAQAAEKVDDKFRYPFYVGIMGGYGSTTWSGLIPPKMTPALALATPNSVSEGGAIWGLMAGYELMPAFAFEVNYMKYPYATINFSKKSLFSILHHGQLSFISNTESVSFSGKLMVVVPRTTVRLFSTVGIAGVRRYDQLKNCWTANPTFGFGLNYNFTSRLMAELGITYTGGYGQSELTPASDYIPFLYSAFFGLAFRF